MQDEFLSTVWDRSDPTGAGGLAVLDEQPARRLPTPPPESGAVSHPDYRCGALLCTRDFGAYTGREASSCPAYFQSTCRAPLHAAQEQHCQPPRQEVLLLISPWNFNGGGEALLCTA